MITVVNMGNGERQNFGPPLGLTAYACPKGHCANDFQKIKRKELYSSEGYGAQLLAEPKLTPVRGLIWNTFNNL
jgi:hypothetical protein